MNRIFIINNFSLESENKIKISVEIDKKEKVFLAVREGIGYTVPGDLQNITTQSIKRSHAFIKLLDNWYNNIPVNLPADLSYFEEY